MYKSISLPKYRPRQPCGLKNVFQQTSASTDPEWNEIISSHRPTGLLLSARRWKDAHTHTHNNEDERQMGVKGVQKRGGEMWGRQRRDFFSKRYDQYFSILCSIKAAQKQFSIRPHSGKKKPNPTSLPLPPPHSPSPRLHFLFFTTEVKQSARNSWGVFLWLNIVKVPRAGKLLVWFIISVTVDCG